MTDPHEQATTRKARRAGMEGRSLVGRTAVSEVWCSMPDRIVSASDRGAGGACLSGDATPPLGASSQASRPTISKRPGRTDSGHPDRGAGSEQGRAKQLAAQIIAAHGADRN